MQNITVKVCYKGKTLIVGKGISSVDQIVKELAKRFPQVQQIKSSLTVGYENGAEDLLSAYKLTQQQKKRFIKVKFTSEQQVDPSFVSEKFDDTCVISVLDPSEEKEKVAQFTKPLQTITFNTRNEQPTSDFFQNFDDRLEMAVESNTNQESSERKDSLKQEIALIEPQKDHESIEDPKHQTEALENIKTKVSEIKNSSDKMDNPIDYGLLDDYFPQKEEKTTVQTNNEKRVNFDKLFGLKNKEPQPKQELLNPDAMIVLNIVRKEFDAKISTLQAQYNDLQIKYSHLSLKYDNLSATCGIKMDVKAESKQIDVQIQHQRKSTEEIKNFQNLFSKFSEEPLHQNDSKLFKTQPILYHVEISEFQTLQNAQVGDIVQSTFRLKNVGLKNWPENVFAQQQRSQQMVEIKSLQANQSAIVTLQSHKAERIGDKINKMYQLVYYDEENNIRKFGRVFGISVNVVEKRMIDPAFLKPQSKPSKPNHGKRPDPTIQFKSYINQIMNKNNLISKSLYDVIACLKDFEVTEYSYKNCDARTLTEFVKSICQ